MPQVTPISPDTPLPTNRAALRPAQQADFIERLAQCGNVREAAKACGISRATVYRLKRNNYLFSQLWKAEVLVWPQAPAFASAHLAFALPRGGQSALRPFGPILWSKYRDCFTQTRKRDHAPAAPIGARISRAGGRAE